MRRDSRMYLEDVIDAAEAVVEFTAGMDLAAYQATRLVRAAVERELQIIGDALNLLSRHAPDIASRVPDLRARQEITASVSGSIRRGRRV